MLNQARRTYWPSLGLVADDYEVIDIVGTLESDECDHLCLMGTHGTTAIFVIAKKGLVINYHKSQRHLGCSNKIPPNKEKGEKNSVILLH